MTTDGKIREALAQKLRVTTAQMARRCSVDLMLWSMHSNACLEAAAILSTQKEAGREVEIDTLARGLAAFLRYDWNGLRADGRVTDKGYQIWSRIPSGFQGTQEDLRDVARTLLPTKQEAEEVSRSQTAMEQVMSTPESPPNPVNTALAFFASVIKSGEPWTSHCQEALDAAHNELIRRVAATTPPSVRSQALEEALREWKCPECDGVGQLKRSQRLGGGFRKCDMCGGARLHPIAAAALSIPAPYAGWRTIDSAPKNGTAIILYLEDEDFSTEGHWREHENGPGWYLPTLNEWGGSSDQAFLHTCTHWQPLPAPPVGDGVEKS